MVRETVLFPTYEQALLYRKAKAAESSQAAFGLDATTPAAWLADTWGLYGDGRALVSQTQRLFAARRALQQVFVQESGDAQSDTGVSADSAPSGVSDGLVKLAARLFSEGAGMPQFDAAVAAPPAHFATEEQAVLRAAVVYRALLGERGLIESGDALAYLANAGIDCRFIMGADFDLPPAFRRFCETSGALCDCEPDCKPQVTALPQGVEPRFLFAAGPSAQNALIAQALQDSLRIFGASYSVAVVSANPLQLYNDLAVAFAGKPVECALVARTTFPETAFGRAYLALVQFVLDGHHDKLALADYLASPFSGVGSARASELDSALRGDRLIAFEEARAMARLTSPHFDAFEELLLDADASLLLDYFVDEATRIAGPDGAWRAEQHAAIKALRGVYEAARHWDASPADFAFMLHDLPVNVSRTAGAGPAHILVVDSYNAVVLPDATYDEVMVCDLDARFWPASGDHSACVALLRKIGVPEGEEPLARLRRRFECAKGCAARRFTCQRVLTVGGEEDIYPAFVLDEFIEQYRAEGEKLDEYGLPATLSGVAQVRGEEHFNANQAFADFSQTGQLGAAVGGSQSTAASLIVLPAGSGAIVESGLLPSLLAGRLSGSSPNERLILSPSAIEAYVNCPYRWFVAQRLRPEAPDEGFGPLEQGTFAHAVFQAFYMRWSSLGLGGRVVPDTLSQARELLGRVFDELLAKQPNEPGVRYVPTSQTEAAEASRLRALLQDNLALQARMLPGFAPYAHELEIRLEDNVEYAGVRLRGRIDRIDVNEELGHYAVLDYKGSVAGHDAGCDPDAPFALPRKVQALIYASALRGRVVGARPVGALYVAYRARKPHDFLAGSFDAALLDVSAMSKGKSAVKMNFDAYLDEVEAAIAERLAGLREGRIEPDPLCADSCRYCPALNCARRLL